MGGTGTAAGSATAEDESALVEDEDDILVWNRLNRECFVKAAGVVVGFVAAENDNGCCDNNQDVANLEGDDDDDDDNEKAAAWVDVEKRYSSVKVLLWGKKQRR